MRHSFMLTVSEPVKIMDEVTYLEVMPNGKDVLLMGPTEGLVTYDSIIEDDLEESDALLTEADGDAYQAKLQRDAIRTAMEGGEGFEPVLQKVYMYSNGKLTEVAVGTISAVSVKNDRPYAVCYAAGDMEKMPISQLGSLEDAEQGYYMTLMYTEPKILVVMLPAAAGSWKAKTFLLPMYSSLMTVPWWLLRNRHTDWRNYAEYCEIGCGTFLHYGKCGSGRLPGYYP